MHLKLVFASHSRKEYSIRKLNVTHNIQNHGLQNQITEIECRLQPLVSILLIAAVPQFRICHDCTSRLFRRQNSIDHRDQKGVSSGSANVGGCCLPLSGRGQKLRGENQWGNFKIRFFTMFRPKYTAGHRDRKWCLHQSTPEY